MAATVALGTTPVILAPGMPVNPAPDPMNLPLVVTLPSTLTDNKLPTVVKLEYRTFELKVLPTKALALEFALVAIPVRNAPLPIK